MKQENPLVLVVDDDPNNLTVLFDVLDTGNYEIRIAKNGERCLEIVQHEKTDLILLDVMMPGMNGFEVCSRLKADRNTRDIPVIFMTALSETINKIRGFELGAVDYITKPFQVEEVMSRIKTHIQLRNLMNKEKETDRIRKHFSSLAGQDLRSSLYILSAGTAYLKHHGAQLKEEDRSAAFQNMEEVIRKMLLILENISASPENRTGPGFFSPESLDIARFTEEIHAEFSRLIQGSHIFDYSCGPGKIRLSADPVLLRYLLFQLLSNAFAYSPRDSKVSLTVCRKDAEICIAVRDQGKGMAKNELPHIFEAFRKSRESRGMGLGLTVAGHFAKLHKGRIEVESEKGKGSVFSLYLPERKDTAAA
ncbi:MAG: hybrid sensor histidine kinase/response regulator [Desulfococcaceae bacterium]|jgi:DNA-binding response OmpR family regulator|nr:hybrid sensor histidine kinase/response regulator [Desulfococcaceae bacterium]